MSDVFRTWIELDHAALRSNVRMFQRLIGPKRRLMAVVKSNAYGHGLVHISKMLCALRGFSERGWFGVDSIVEGLRLRSAGIQIPILVLGYTLPKRLSEAAEKKITITVSNFESLTALYRLIRANKRIVPEFHIKIDTGMRRQGFLPGDVPRLIRELKRKKLRPSGIYTHFAAAKDPENPAYTRLQLSEFKKALSLFSKAGFRRMVRHAAASSATLLFPETYFDMVRIGMGLYGYAPSPDMRRVAGDTLTPVLSWKTIVSEIKKIPAGSAVGYDLTESVLRPTTLAVIPVGYWHGYDRGLSSIGEVIVRGKRAKILGRISMDMIVVDVTDIGGVRVGDTVTLIGRDGKEYIGADAIAEKIGTTPYEVLTRLNPLIFKKII